MKPGLKVLFYLKKNQKKENGLCPVMCRLTVGKSMSQFSLKTDAGIRLWDTKAGRMTGKSRPAQDVNRAIDRINLVIHTRYRELLEINPVVDAGDLKNAVQGIASTQACLLDSFKTMNAGVREKVGTDYSRAAYEQYRKSYHSLEGFIRQKLKLSDIPLKALTYSHLEAYYNYLRVDSRLSIGTSGIYLVYFRKVVRNAVNRGILSHDPFYGFVPEKAEIVHKSLTGEELDKFMSAEPKNGQQETVKDIFLFGVFTGLSYIDMKNLSYNDIQTMEDGSRWIVSKRQKTGVEYRVRLLDIPLSIIEKYRGKYRVQYMATTEESKVLPVPGKMSLYRGLNALAKRCGIEKRISVHQSRHTFASLITLSEGVPIETVSRMLGHKYIKTTQRYAELSLDKIREDMKALSQRIEGMFILEESPSNLREKEASERVKEK